eukprot:9939882-Alexandrium_andersonii.AAC.1
MGAKALGQNPPLHYVPSNSREIHNPQPALGSRRQLRSPSYKASSEGSVPFCALRRYGSVGAPKALLGGFRERGQSLSGRRSASSNPRSTNLGRRRR